MTTARTIGLPEFARQLGVPYHTALRWTHEGMPADRSGGMVRIAPVAARAWVQRHRADSISVNRKSSVYFARAEDGAIKIGWSSDPARRETELHKRCAHGRAVVVAQFDGDKFAESALHERFVHLRLDGEWFRGAPDLAEYIERVADGTAPLPPTPLSASARRVLAEASRATLYEASGDACPACERLCRAGLVRRVSLKVRPHYHVTEQGRAWLSAFDAFIAATSTGGRS